MKRWAREPQGGAILASLLSLLVLLAGWVWAGNWYEDSLIKQERADVDVQITARASSLASAVNQRIALLQGLYALTRTEWPGTDFDHPFEVYASGLYFESPGLRTLMIAPEGVARYVYPGFDFQILSGYDILNDPDPATRDDVQRAIHTRQIALSQPGELKQGGFGLTAWRAVYRGKDLWGMVSMALDMKTVLEDAGLASPWGGLEVALHDSAGQTFFGPATVWQHAPAIRQIALPEGSWELGGVPQGGWGAPIQAQMQIFHLGSLALVGLAAALVYLVVNRQGQLSQAVEMRTRQIAAAQQELEQRVQERTRQLSTLLQVSRRVASTLSLEPLLVQILDEMKAVLDYESACIFHLETPQNLTLVSQRGLEQQAHARRSFPLADYPHMAQVIESGQVLIQENSPAAPGESACWMGVPLMVKDRAIGMITFSHRQLQAFNAGQANLAMAFAQQAAVAIENARLYEQAGQLAALQERQRLARELHDSISQVLYGIGLGAKTARSNLESNLTQAAQSLDYVNRLAEAGQVEMRALIFELRPESLRIEGLVAALEKQAAVLRARYQINVQSSLCPEPQIPLVLKENLYRIAQEALHNIVRHARASQVILTLEYDAEQISLQVADNGVGFDPAAGFPGHLGLQSMRERASLSGGVLNMTSAAGKGTCVQAVIPVQPNP